MTRGVSLPAVGNATSISLAITFVLCIGFGLLFPSQSMHQAWEHLLPGFRWISWKSFMIGFLESYAYGWYVALVWVPLYNVFSKRATAGAATQ